MNKRFEVGTVIDDMEVIEQHFDNKARPRYTVRCKVCGYIRSVNAWTFEEGKGTTHLSCAMDLKRNAQGEERTVIERMYHSYCAMVQRIQNPNAKSFPYGGQRGLENTFIDWMHFYVTMRPTYFIGAQLDRENNDKGYSPENCRWVTAKENSRNRRSNIPVEVTELATGKVYEFPTVIEFIEYFGLPNNTSAYRVIDQPTRSYHGFRIRSLTGNRIHRNPVPSSRK